MAPLAGVVRRMIASVRPVVLRAWSERRVEGLLLAAWVLAMVALPIVKAVGGDGPLRAGVALTVLLQAALVLVILVRAWGARRALATAAVVVALGWLVEMVGSHTGVPFGVYQYTDRLGPRLLGVPLVIPLAWLMMLPCAWAVADWLTGGRRDLAFVATSAVAFTAWDLFLDPQMVLWRFWEWGAPGGYFGIPWVNFAGWLLASAVITAVARPGPLPAAALVVVYGVTWFLETVGLVAFWGLPGPGMVGGVVMGACLALALWQHGHR